MTRKLVVAAMAALGLVACRAETGTTLQILDVPAVETDCTIAATPSHLQARGRFDPVNALSYFQFVWLQNNTLETVATITAGNQVNSNANDAIVIGYDACFYRADDPNVVAYNPKGKGLAIDCDKVPGNQRLFIPGSGTVSSGGGTLTTGFDVLDIGQLQALFGASFDPGPAMTGIPTDTATRSAAWGDFPASFTAEVVLQFRARAKDQGGHLMRSNWFPFPIEIEPFFASNPCGTGNVVAAGSCDPAQGQPFTCAAATP